MRLGFGRSACEFVERFFFANPENAAIMAILERLQRSGILKKGESIMVQFIMERNLLLYLLSAACVAAVASQMILKQVYDRLIRDTRNTGEPDGKFLQQLRQRFQYCRHLNEKVGDVQALIRKNLMEYRFWGMGLHRWKRLGVELLSVSLLCAFAGSVYFVRGGGAVVNGNSYFWMGLLAAALVAASYAVADTGYRRGFLEVQLADYLENSGAVRDYSEDAAQAIAEEEPAPIVSVESRRKTKRRTVKESAATQTRAQREKNDLKENLARVKAGMQETAAAGERERNAELLRHMDPAEQERILREVLREFLS